MIARFSLYGFLKNLRLFEAFLILALREAGLDFLSIGALIAVREITRNLFEIPSGALADALGRKRCMVASMAAYLTSYLVLGSSGNLLVLSAGMVLFGVGDAFRTGTHKAMILTWLRAERREGESTRVYGYTRSWSKAGSALSALLAGALVFVAEDYSMVFIASALPAAVNLVNLASYPSWLNGEPRKADTHWLRGCFDALKRGLEEIKASPPLRGLLRDSMTVEGSYTVVKDYLQPVLQYAALSIPIALSISQQQRTALLCGVVYAALYLLAMVASKSSHRVESRLGGGEQSARKLIIAISVLYLLLTAALVGGIAWAAIAIFVVLGVLQNFWRPIHISRFDKRGKAQTQATVLSVESQAKSLAAAVLAPIVGALIDALHTSEGAVDVVSLWPVGLVAIPLIALLLVRQFRSS